MIRALAFLALIVSAMPASAEGRQRYHRDEVQLPEPVPVFQSRARDTRSAKEIREREAAWLTRCKPEIVTGANGVGRYRYAAAGCEYGD